MALDNPVLPDTTTGFWRGSRLVELAMVVALTVSVVVVAAIWGPGSGDDEAGSRASVAPIEPVSSLAVSEVSITQAEAQGSAEPTESASVAAAETSVPGTSSSRPEPPVQSGILPGRPDPSEPALPASFERYQVQRGESLFSIASARGVSVAELLHWNWQLDDDSVLIRGEWLWIPEWDLSAVAEESVGPSEEGKSGRGGG